MRDDLLDDGTGGWLEKPLCPFCSQPWTDEMVKMLYDEDRWGSESTGDFTSINWILDITCTSCARLIYRKEGRRTF